VNWYQRADYRWVLLAPFNDRGWDWIDALGGVGAFRTVIDLAPLFLIVVFSGLL
jgi:hypothetical protein